MNHPPIFLIPPPSRRFQFRSHHSSCFKVAISTPQRKRKRPDALASQVSSPTTTTTTTTSTTTTTATATNTYNSNSQFHADVRTQLAQFFAGALAGFVNTLVLSPLDVVKTRLQAQGSSSYAVARYTGLVHALRRMLREEGFTSYYRGLPASLCAFVPNWAIYWYTYEQFKRIYTPPGHRDTPIVHITSALSAGGITAVSTAPFWTLKSRMQIETATRFITPKYRSVAHGLRTIIREEGVTALYKGLTPTLFGLGHVAIQFPLYEYLKRYFSNGQSDQVRADHVLAASSISKVVASAIFYPHEVLRTRIQTETSVISKGLKPGRAIALFQDILKKEGARGLYRGFGTNLIRTVPACMLTFTSYELVKRYAEKYNLKQRQLVEERQLGHEETLAKGDER